MLLFTVFACFPLFVREGVAIPIWPSPIDELEDIMFLNSGYGKRGFADAVTPCSYSAAGPGRITAAEWLRTAFHDMATASIFFGGSGGLDASIMFETDRSENIGAAFNISLAFFANYFSARVSVSDLIALSVYTSVRSCGGPIVPIRAGRADATVAGPIGVPLPENSAYTFEQQFQRTGFNTSEMIAMTACGHTVGGVHAADFPQIVPVGTAPNDFKAIDSTVAVFDNKIATEWVAGNTSDPMSLGPSVAAGRNSDAKVFGADNVTMQALTDPSTFASTCSSILQRMIEVVPPGTVFSDPIQPYEVKPSALQLTLLSGGTSISFTGLIRMRTTVRPLSSIARVQLIYKDRNGGDTCGSCTISTSIAGTSAGFDDSFAFYSFSSSLPSDSSISSFNVLVTLTGSGTELHDNNGTGFPIQDSIMLQSPQSCLNQGNLTIVAAVRNTRTSLPVSLDLSLMVPRQGAIVPALQNSSLSMVEGSAVGPYSLYSISCAITPNQTSTTRFDISSGVNTSRIADAFKSTADLTSKCASLSSGGLGSSSYTSTKSSSSISTNSMKSSTTISTTKMTSVSLTTTSRSFSTSKSSSSLRTTSSKPSTLKTSTSSSTSSRTSTSSSQSSKSPNSSSSYTPSTSTTSTSSATFSQTAPALKSNIANYTYYGCQTEATNIRALSSAAFAADTMTLEACAAFCDVYVYWGVEYARECYCGNAFNAGSIAAPVTDCNFLCAGDSLEYCGAGKRLSVYVLKTVGTTTTATISSSSLFSSSSSSLSSSPSSTASSSTSSSSRRSSLTSSSSSSSSFIISSSTKSPVTSSTSTCTSSTTSLTTPLPTGPVHVASAGGYSWIGCYTEATNSRALKDAALYNYQNMTVEMCQAFCSSPTAYPYLGIEYGGECYCGGDLQAGSVLAPTTDCNMPCGGSAYEYCGAGNRLDVYQFGGSVSSSSSSSKSTTAATIASTTSTSTSSTASTTTGPAIKPTVGSYRYYGCQTEATNMRALSSASTATDSMTLELCESFCSGYTYWGTEYGRECYCGNSFGAGSVVALASDCSFPCPGNKLEYCGAGNRLSVYSLN